MRPTRALVALVLAAVVGIGWSVALVLAAGPKTEPINDSAGALLATVGGVLAGAVAGYLGSRPPNDDGD